MVLPYYPGSLYAAYEAKDGYQVSYFNKKINRNIGLLFQGATVTVFNARPGFLCYHAHTVHVTEIQHTVNIHDSDQIKVFL